MKCQSFLIFLENGVTKFFGMVSQGTLNLICDGLSVKIDIFSRAKDNKKFAQSILGHIE